MLDPDMLSGSEGDNCLVVIVCVSELKIFEHSSVANGARVHKHMGLVAFGASDVVSLARVPKRFTLIGNMFEKY